MFDIPFLAMHIRNRTGVGLRSLGEHQHDGIPVWRRLLSNLGTVNGTRENTRQLLADGEAVLVFPGGGREVARRR